MNRDRPDCAGGSRRAWLALGGVHHLNGAAPAVASDLIVLAALERPVEEIFPSNTVVLRWDDLGAVGLRAVTRDRGLVAEGSAAGADLLPDMLPGVELRRLQSIAGGTGAGTLVPLFYLTGVVSGLGYEMHVHTQIRFLEQDACFIRLTRQPIAIDDLEALGWLPEVVSAHAQQSVFLGNHQRYYRRCFAGKELEYKYTLDPPADIWTLTIELYRQLREGRLAGYLMEYRDEFQAWDYENHLFQVSGSEAERGYVSFIPTTDGKNLVKRKRFSEDSFERTETHTYGVVPRHGYAAYVRDELGLTATALPPFRRVRYDVNFESIRTGHVYGVFFDHVSVLEAPEVVLNQCELEYLRTRTALEPDDQDVLSEIEVIADWLELFLRKQACRSERGYYSKLSFLIDVSPQLEHRDETG